MLKNRAAQSRVEIIRTDFTATVKLICSHNDELFAIDDRAMVSPYIFACHYQACQSRGRKSERDIFGYSNCVRRITKLTIIGIKGGRERRRESNN